MNKNKGVRTEGSEPTWLLHVVRGQQTSHRFLALRVKLQEGNCIFRGNPTYEMFSELLSELCFRFASPFGIKTMLRRATC